MEHEDGALYAVFLCDIVGYSQLKPSEQSKAQARLWRYARLLDPSLLSKANVWSTGDGFYLVISLAESPNLELLYLEAKKFLYKCEQNNLRVRGALHEGLVERLNHVLLGSTLFAGPGLNDVARIVDFAGANQIALSDTFCKHLESESESSDTDRFSPPLSEDFYSFYVKHNESVHFRLNSNKISPFLSKMLMYREEINHEITDIQVEIKNTLVNIGLLENKDKVQIYILEK